MDQLHTISRPIFAAEKLEVRRLDYFALPEEFHRLFRTYDRQFAASYGMPNKGLKTLRNSAWTKNNQLSSSLLRTAASFRTSELRYAIESCTKALCCAEIHTDQVSMVYYKRANYYYQMNSYHQALVDIELAHKAGCSAALKLELEILQGLCQKFISDESYKTALASKNKLETEENNSIPCLADELEIATNEQFGRHIVAKRNIGVNKIISAEENFASINVHDAGPMCYTCSVDSTNFIPCPDCADVVFCSLNCMQSNLVHKIDCQTTYHRMTSELQYNIRTILMAVTAFPNIEMLMTFVQECVISAELPKSVNDLPSKYGLYLKLSKSPLKKDVMLDSYEVFEMILTIPAIERLFDSEQKQRFLMCLCAHHLAINRLNSFGDEESASIFSVSSLYNHSCAPNLSIMHIANWMFCKTNRKIEKGEQLFISYLGDYTDQPTEWRRDELKSLFQFECKCSKCTMNK